MVLDAISTYSDSHKATWARQVTHQHECLCQGYRHRSNRNGEPALSISVAQSALIKSQVAHERTYQAVQMMISAQLTEITRAIIEFNCCSIHLLEFILTYAYIVVFEKVMPSFVQFRARLASIWVNSLQSTIIEYLLVCHCSGSWCYVTEVLARMLHTQMNYKRGDIQYATVQLGS